MKNILLICSLYLATFLISPNLNAKECIEEGKWVSEKDSIESINVQYPKSCDSMVVDIEPTTDLSRIYNQIEYPILAKRANIQGQVTIKILVDKAGKVRKYVILDSANELLVPEALKAVLSVIYKPAIYKLQAIDCWLTIPIRFTLR